MQERAQVKFGCHALRKLSAESGQPSIVFKLYLVAQIDKLKTLPFAQ